MSPQQELFTTLLTSMRNAGLDVYDGVLPPDGTPYPFVYLADVSQSDSFTKGSIGGNISVTINVWHDDYNKRGVFSSIVDDVVEICRRVHLFNDKFYYSSVNQQFMNDSSVTPPLMRAMITANFVFI